MQQVHYILVMTQVTLHIRYFLRILLTKHFWRGGVWPKEQSILIWIEASTEAKMAKNDGTYQNLVTIQHQHTGT